MVQTQVTMPFGPLYCNHNALNTSQMAVLMYIEQENIHFLNMTIEMINELSG